MYHWDGRAWHVLVVPATVYAGLQIPSTVFTQAILDGTGGLWASLLNSTTGTNRLVHYSQGRWSVVLPPQFKNSSGQLVSGIIEDIAAIPGSTWIWVAIDTPTNERIYRYQP